MTDKKLYLGAAYYPEHWPDARWETEIYLMKVAGLNVVRMGEFAWSSLEPAEGEFHFDWLDRVIEMLQQVEINVVLGTPTAAPPAWLCQQYPDLMAVEEDGWRVQFGNRVHYCVNSPEFHQATRRIVGAMAEHFGPHPNVIGWQIDNEFSRVCHCPRCQEQFQVFLAEKYQSLDNLNARWSTAYWSQTYSAWNQIPLPVGPHNPALMLEFKRFVTHSYRRYQKLQIDLLRPHLRPEVWITHNFMGWFGGLDHYEMTADLDLASWDWYIGTGRHDYLKTGAVHDLTRGFKRQNYWVMETQPGTVNWSTVNSALDKGEGRAMAWHAVAHGADGFLYWQWRSALGGQEQYHGSIVDQSGQTRPFYDDVRELGIEFKRVSGLIAGSTVKAGAAILNDYNSRWSIEWQRHHKDFDYVKHINHYYRPLAALNIPVDIISADAPLDNYKMVVAPALIMLNEERVAHIKEFLKKGGSLVLTLRTGMKDMYNALLPARQPGPLAEAAGVEVEEYYALNEPATIKGAWLNGTVHTWAERLKITDTSSRTITIARYTPPAGGWLDDQLAVAVHGAGYGMVYYVGAYLDDAAQQVFIEHVARIGGLKPLKTPEGVEIRTRTSAAGEDIYFVINHNPAEQVVYLPWLAHEHLQGVDLQYELKLPPYGAAVLTKLADS